MTTLGTRHCCACVSQVVTQQVPTLGALRQVPLLLPSADKEAGTGTPSNKVTQLAGAEPASVPACSPSLLASRGQEAVGEEEQVLGSVCPLQGHMPCGQKASSYAAPREDSVPPDSMGSGAQALPWGPLGTFLQRQPLAAACGSPAPGREGRLGRDTQTPALAPVPGCSHTLYALSLHVLASLTTLLLVTRPCLLS